MLAPTARVEQDTLRKMRSSAIFICFSALIVSQAIAIDIEVGPGSSLGKTSWGEESSDEFSGWGLSDIVYIMPPDKSRAEIEESTMVGYRRATATGFFLRLDFASLSEDELHRSRPAITITPLAKPEVSWWRSLLTRVLPYTPPSRDPVSLSPKFQGPQTVSHWSSELSSMEAFIPEPEWALVELEVRVKWKGREETLLLPSHQATVHPALVAVVAHGNQPVSPSVDLGWHLYDHPPGRPFVAGMHNLLETHRMFTFPINLHLSGSLLAALSWHRQDPASPFYPNRDGAHFLRGVGAGLEEGWASLIGGVFAEHIMPYFEGEVNVRSMRAYGDLVKSLFDLTEEEMPVMHIPERVMQSDSAWGALRGKPYTGNPFPDIIAAGYKAAYLDEVTHLHHWFYPDEHQKPEWTESRYGKWAGADGDDDEPYHHKIHRINGVLCFVINDREDSAKFYAPTALANPKASNLSIPASIKWPLLAKAASGDPAQLTLLFDDWESFAGNCFDCPPVDNAARWHSLVRWMHSRPWIKGVHLRDILVEAEASPPSWVIDHGEVDGKRLMAYEWLQRATEHSYDNWYYGSSLEESFFFRHPVFSPDGKMTTPLPYGDLSNPQSIIYKTWAAIRPQAPEMPISPAELGFYAMTYETAWHDEDMPLSSYKSRNYQKTFDRFALGSMEDFTYDRIAGWALDLQGHIRKSLVPARADRWAAESSAGTVGEETTCLAEDLDMDGVNEYVMFNDKVFAVMENWGARLPYVFVRSPSDQAVQVVGVGVARPSSEGDGEESSTGKVSAFQDSFSEGMSSRKYIDMPHRVKKESEGFSTVSSDGLIRKNYTLKSNRLSCLYEVSPEIGVLHVRFGLSPDWPFLMRTGQEGMISVRGVDSDQLHKVSSKSGAWTKVEPGPGVQFGEGELPFAGYLNRGSPMTEQLEVSLPPGSFEVHLSAGHE